LAPGAVRPVPQQPAQEIENPALWFRCLADRVYISLDSVEALQQRVTPPCVSSACNTGHKTPNKAGCCCKALRMMWLPSRARISPWMFNPPVTLFA
jgi:hypothetical protein